MADPILNKLIEVVQNLAENRSGASPASARLQNDTTKVEDTMKALYPSTKGRSTTFNPNTSYCKPKTSKRRSASTSSVPSKKKSSERIACKAVLKDFILLPSPSIENVPRGQFREYLYGEGFAESGVTLSEEMDENEVREMLNKLFKNKLDMSPVSQITFVRAIGNKIIDVNNGPFTGKLLKHISKQGPVYIRSTVNICEDVSKWVRRDEETDSEEDNDQTLMKPAFERFGEEEKKEKKHEVKETIVVPYDEKPSTSGVSTDKSAYSVYLGIMESEVIDEQEEQDIQNAIMASLGDGILEAEEDNSNGNGMHSTCIKEILSQHQLQCMQFGEPQELIIRRSQIWKTALFAVKPKNFNCCQSVFINFIGEEGADAGGPRREFFRLVIKEIIHNSGLLEGPEENKYFSHNLKLLEEENYLLAGRLVGMSIMQDGPGLGCLDPTLYDLMCELPCNLNKFDVKCIVDRKFVEVIDKLKALKSDQEFQTFKDDHAEYIEEHGYPAIYTSKLNQKLYILHTLVKQHLLYRVSSEIQAFKQGLNDVGGLWDKIKMHRKEFKPLFIYQNKPLTRSCLQSLIAIEWSPEGSNRKKEEEGTIYFWEIFLKHIEEKKQKHEINGEEVEVKFEDILKFVTGADKVPPLGFPHKLSLKFYDKENGVKRLPNVSTCALELWLPRGIDSLEEFDQLFSQSLFQSCGFGKP